MSSVTLAESAKLDQDMLVVGVIEDIITVNQAFQVMPFQGIHGNAIAYDREKVLGDVQVVGVGDSITAKAPAQFDQITSSLTTILGDAEVNQLIQKTRSTKQDQTAAQVSSKAKACGRKYQDMFINGSGGGNEFEGLLTLCPVSQEVPATGVDGDNLSFATLDELIDLVTAQDGKVDFFQMNGRTRRSYMSLLRGLGGASIGDTVELPSGQKVPSYRDVPIFRNDYIPIDQTVGITTTATTVIAGCWDDGSMSNGIAGLTADEAMGIEVEYVGIHQSKDEKIYRVKWYSSCALYSQRAISMATGIKN